MAETSRQQDEWAERLATRYGRCRVTPLPDGAVILTGMCDDIERMDIKVTPEGRCSSPTVHDRAAAERHARRYERVECWRCGYPTRASLPECVRCGSPLERAA